MPKARVTNNIELDYEIFGAGEPLLLIHGLGMQRTDWPPSFIDAIVAQGFQVVAFDNRDIGLSTECEGSPPTKAELAKAALVRRPPKSAYLLADMAADAVGLLDALGLDRAHVVGASMGGMIAQTVAINHPDRVASLVSIMSTTGNPSVGRPKPKIMLDVMRRRQPDPESIIDDAVETMAAVAGPSFDDAAYREIATVSVNRSYRPEGMGRQLGAILASPDRTADLQALDVPTLVIHGLVDPLVQHSGGIATAKAIAGSRLLTFADMGHDLPRHRNEEIAAAIAANAARQPIRTHVGAAPLV